MISGRPIILARAIEATRERLRFLFHRQPQTRAPQFTRAAHIAGRRPRRFIAAAQQQSGVLEIPTDYMVGLIVKEFPTQASTVVYKRSIAPYLRFDTRLKAAGEDVLFFAALVSTANRVWLRYGQLC